MGATTFAATVNTLVLATTLGEAVNIEPVAREIAAVGPATGLAGLLDAPVGEAAVSRRPCAGARLS